MKCQLIFSTSKKSLILVYKTYLKNILKTLKISYSFLLRRKKLKLITLLRSPHVHKKSKEQFLGAIYKLNLFCKNVSLAQINSILINKPSVILLQLKIVNTDS